MPNDILHNNLEALRARSFLSASIEEAVKNFAPDVYKVEQAKKGGFTLSVCDKDAAPVLLHSRYAPEDEAKKQIETGYKGQTSAILFGFGLGYAAEILAGKMPEIKGPPQLFIIEPDAAVFVAAMSVRDLTKLIADKRIAFLVGMTTEQVGNFWLVSLDWGYLEDLAVIEHPPTCARHREYYERILEKIRFLSRRSMGNLSTMMNAGFAFHQNQFHNLAPYFTLPGVGRLFGKFEGVPAIVVSAGPSLDKNVDQLKKVKGKFPIIAVDTAFRQLISHGITPDIVCAADPSYENSLDFVGVEDEKDCIAALEPMTHPDIFNNFHGPKMAMAFGGGIHKFYDDLREPVGDVICWGSISTTVFDLAVKIGADPIVLIGLDLSFEEGRLHASGSLSDDMMYEKTHKYTSIEHECADYVLTRGKVKCLISNGSVLYTDNNMKMYYDWFADRFRSTKAKVINATEGGIVKKYVTEMPLSQVISEYEGKGTDVKRIIDDAMDMPVKADIKSLYDRVNKYAGVLDKMKADIEKVKAISDRLMVKCKGTSYLTLRGEDAKLFCDVLKVHDSFCAEKNAYAWFSAYHAKFSTKHTMEVNKLKRDKQTTVGAWLEEMNNFFDAVCSFYDFQMPLLKEVSVQLCTSSGLSDGGVLNA